MSDDQGAADASGSSSPRDGAAVLHDVEAFIGRYVSFPNEHCLPVVALWAAHTHAVPCFYVTPRLVLDSAEPGSGKTRVLEVLALLCSDPEMTISITPPAIFRLLKDKPYTLLFDEVDAIFNPKSGGNYEDLRALLNAGYKRGATIARCVGDAKSMRVDRFTVFAPVALAGIAGHMPATITTRAITIHMRRRAPGETVEPFRERHALRDAKPVMSRLSEWVGQAWNNLRDAEPKLPDGVVDRPAEVWEALVAIADAAGGDWPRRARAACKHFVLRATSDTQSLGERLLADLRRIFGARREMASTEVVARLVELDEAPWSDLRGQPLSMRKLADLLRRYEVCPVTFRGDDDRPAKGYTTYAVDRKGQQSAGLADAWSRYLPTDSGLGGNSGNSGNGAGQGALPIRGTAVTAVTARDHVTAVTDAVTDPAARLTRAVTAVTAVTPKSCRGCGEPIDPAAGDVHPDPSCQRRGSRSGVRHG